MAWGDEDPDAGVSWGNSDPDVSARAKSGVAKRKRSLGENIAGAMANLYRGTGVLDEVQGGMRAVENVVRGRSKLDASSLPNLFGSVGDAFGQGMREQRAQEDQFAAEHPAVANLARGTGLAAAAAIPTGPSANLFAQGSRLGNMARGATAAGLTGAAYTAADRGTASERMQGAGRTARDPLTLGLGAAGGAIAPAASRRPAREVRPEVRTLSEAGVEMTPGQMIGGPARQIEDAATSVPILGPSISAARRRGLESFNRVVLNRALEPLGEELPANVQIGHEATAYVGNRISRGYRDLLPEGGVRADPGFTDDVARLADDIQTLTPANAERLNNIIEQRLASRLGADGRLTGQMYQRVMGEMETEAGRFSRSTDADEQAIGNILQGVRTAVRDAAERQNPRFGERIRQLNAAWANLTRAETAAAAGKDPSGIFTPAQYDSAVKAGSDTVRRRGYARGEALGQDLSSAAKAVLPSTVNDSGTATRGAVSWVLGGGAGIAGGSMGLAGATAGLGAASQAYSPRAIALANRALARRIAGRDRQAALNELRRVAANDPSARRLLREVRARLGMAAGVAGAGAAAPVQAGVVRDGNVYWQDGTIEPE